MIQEEIDEMIKDINTFFNTDIREKTRGGYAVKGRRYFYYFFKKFNKCSFEKAGSIFGQDHSTVIHAVNTLEFHIDTYIDEKENYEKLKDILAKYNQDNKTFICGNFSADFSYSTFKEAEKQLKSKHHNVVNPIELTPIIENDNKFILSLLDIIQYCKSCYFLIGWDDCKISQFIHDYCELKKIEILYQE
jgi:hypothetical protein